jgi:hypothetical protein
MVLIEGVAFPLDEKNHNGWGIPSSEIDNVLNSLKTAVVRICTGKEPHGCDFQYDPFSEIGHPAEIRINGADINVVADITDSVASRKIDEGTWMQKDEEGNLIGGWSIFTEYDDDADGWLKGVNIKSLTLVKEPAWDKAVWTKAASEGETSSLLFYKPFKILVGNTMDEKTTPTTDGGGIPAEYDALLKEKESIINELTTTKTKLETEFQALKEQFEAANGELSTLKQAAASKDAELSKSITLEEADKRIAAAIDGYKESIAREAALGKLAAARKARGYETNFEEYAKDPVSRITKLAEDFENMKAASKEPVYPSSASSSGGFTVGNKNSGKWEA